MKGMESTRDILKRIAGDKNVSAGFRACITVTHPDSTAAEMDAVLKELDDERAKINLANRAGN